MKIHLRLPHCSCTHALVIAWLGSWLILGCAGLPQVQPMESSGTPPILVGAQGELTSEQSKAILQALDRHGPSDLLEKHLSTEEAIADLPLVVGNRVTLLQDGPATYKAMYAAIRAARDNINLEIYMLEDDEIGRQLAGLLLAEQKRGVQINVIYDSVGSLNTPASFFQHLTDQGANVLQFNPINPLEARENWYVDNRDHRKLLIVDGRVAFTGGINYSGVYSRH